MSLKSRDAQRISGPVQPPLKAKTAKVFKNGRSQAVRLPAEFRFEQPEVYIRRDEATGDVILSQQERPIRSWAQLLAEINHAVVPDDFMSAQDRDRSEARPLPEF